MLIYVKGCYTLLGKINVESKEERYRFKIPIGNDQEVTVEITPDKNEIESICRSEISDEMWKVLQTGVHDGRKLSSKLQDELNEIISQINSATRKVMNLIKYCLNQIDLDENLFSLKLAGTHWSIDKSKWETLPVLLKAIISIENIIPLDYDNSKTIQEYIVEGFEPFIALRHLQKAKKETNPRYKWIDATIAAELAIKEFYIKLKPEIETLLLEVPSPPLHKLYGSILESFINERSPKLKEIAKGVEIRNKLLHRPKEFQIDDQDAIIYVQDIEIAIYHLLHKLYPKDPIITKFYSPRAIIKKE